MKRASGFMLSALCKNTTFSTNRVSCGVIVRRCMADEGERGEPDTAMSSGDLDGGKQEDNLNTVRKSSSFIYHQSRPHSQISTKDFSQSSIDRLNHLYNQPEVDLFAARVSLLSILRCLFITQKAFCSPLLDSPQAACFTLVELPMDFIFWFVSIICLSLSY